MGMYDRITCKYPLPDCPMAAEMEFQTKDLDCRMTSYEITAEGRLVEHQWEWEKTPPDELPYAAEMKANPDPKGPQHDIRRFFGSIRRKKGTHRIVDLKYHGDLNFYGNIHSGELRRINLKTGKDGLHPDPEPEWFEYSARFTNGTLARIERVDDPDA